MENITDLIKQSILKIENTNIGKKQFTGVHSGINELDKITSGWQKSELAIIGGRPAIGKTAFALSIARNAVIDFGNSVVIFTLNTTALQISTRLISIESGISIHRLNKGNNDIEQINSKINKLSSAPLYIDDTPGLTVAEIRNKILKLKEKHNVDLIIIDYLHEIIDELPIKRTSTQEISSITTALKLLAMELNVPVIAFSRVNPTAEKNKNYHPTIIDLPDYKGIIANASTIMFLNRPEYYNIEVDENGISTKGVAELIIEKQNNEFCNDTIVKINYESKFWLFSDYKIHSELQES